MITPSSSFGKGQKYLLYKQSPEACKRPSWRKRRPWLYAVTGSASLLRSRSVNLSTSTSMQHLSRSTTKKNEGQFMFHVFVGSSEQPYHLEQKYSRISRQVSSQRPQGSTQGDTIRCKHRWGTPPQPLNDSLGQQCNGINPLPCKTSG